MKDCITAGDLKQFSERFAGDPANVVAMNAVTTNGVQESARQFTSMRKNIHQYSVKLPQNGITWQKNSGRCWMYAGFNIMRDKVIKELNLESFEFSGNYLMFYDRLEKANYFLEAVLQNPDEKPDGRLFEKLLWGGAFDGGEWEMFVNLVQKYGIVPAEAQPETNSTVESRTMPQVVTEKLRGYARDLHRAQKAGKTADELRAQKEEMLNTIYRMYAISYGEPVKTFDFEARSKDDKFICDRGITPQEFYKKYVGIDLGQYINICAGSTDGKELKKYEITHLPYVNVIEGIPMAYVSVSVETLKKACLDQLQGGEPVWFGCDVGEFSWRNGGILDDDLYGYEQLFNTKFTMTKADRFAYNQAHMSHAMTFKGVDLDDAGKPVRWCVENTWGPDVGKKGMFVMTDGWFDKYTYQAIINRKYLSPEIIDTFDNTESTKLAPWTMHR